MTINTLPTAPLRTMSPAEFVAAANTFLAALPTFSSQVNADLAALLTLSQLVSTSTTSLTVGTGSKSLTVQTSKAYLANQAVRIYSTATPDNYMDGTVTSYDSGTGALVVNVTATNGSGTLAAWTVILNGGLATTVDLNAAVALRALLAGSASQVFSVGLATAAAHAVSRSFGDARYAEGMLNTTVVATANDLVCTLKAPCKIDFGDASLPSGLTVTSDIASDLTLTVPNGATLGTSNGAAARLDLIVAYNGGAPVLCIANPTGTLNLSESGVISPTTISTGADSADVVYSASAVSANSPYRVIKGIDITEATAGVWASNPTNVFDMGANPLTGAVVTASDTGTNLNVAGYFIAARINSSSSGASYVTSSATYGNAFASHSLVVHGSSCTVDLFYNNTTALMQQTLTFPEFGTYEVHLDVWASTYSTAYRNGLSATAKRIQR